MISTRSLTPEEKEISDIFNKAGRVLVIKNVTVLNSNKFHTIKAGSLSIEYAFCNYHFLDENGVNCYINSAPVQANPDLSEEVHGAVNTYINDVKSLDDLDQINDTYLVDGWKVKNMVSNNDSLILLLEKETRKEKLDELDIISKS